MPACLEVLDTPDTPTIDSLVTVMNKIEAGGRSDWEARDTLKNVVLTLTQPDGSKELLVIGVPGDRDIDMKRLEANVYPAMVAMFDDFASRPDLVRGYIGPQGPARFRYLVDPRVAAGTSWITGANVSGKHAINVVCGRDFTPDGTIEAADVRAGDACPNCGTGVEIRRGIEIAHIFALGRRFTDAFEVDAIGADGVPIRVTMGSYGIGITRAIATIAEQHLDERGLVWPASVAPADVHIVATGTDQIEPAIALGALMETRGLRVIVDDRPGISAGVKFTDAELLGIPTAVVVGRRFVEGYVELRDRRSGAREDVGDRRDRGKGRRTAAHVTRSNHEADPSRRPDPRVRGDRRRRRSGRGQHPRHAGQPARLASRRPGRLRGVVRPPRVRRLVTPARPDRGIGRA